MTRLRLFFWLTCFSLLNLISSQLDPANLKNISEIQAERKLAAEAAGSSGEEDWSDEDQDQDSEHAGDTDEEMIDSDMEEVAQASTSTQNNKAASYAALQEKVQAKLAGMRNQKLGKVMDEPEEELNEEEAKSRTELLEARRKRGEVRDKRRIKRKAERRAEKEIEAKNGGKEKGKDGKKKDSAATGSNRAPALLVNPKDKNGKDEGINKSSNVNSGSESLTFSSLNFNHPNSTNPEEVKSKKFTLSSDPKTALAMLEAKKRREEKRAEKLAAKGDESIVGEGGSIGLSEIEKAEAIKWQKVQAAASGTKIKDDETLLKKTIKRREKEKSKSSKEWIDRKKETKEKETEKARKREENIQKRITEKKDKRMGKKKPKISSGGKTREGGKGERKERSSSGKKDLGKSKAVGGKNRAGFEGAKFGKGGSSKSSGGKSGGGKGGKR